MQNVKKILVAGDIMLDTYHFGKVDRISPEAPVPVFLEMGQEKQVPGGAANVAVNLAAIGIGTDIFSVVGCDGNGSLLLRLLGESNVGTHYIYQNQGGITTNKLRYIGQNNQQILRADTENVMDLSAGLLKGLIEGIRENIADYGLILLSDYKKGFLTEEIAQLLITLGKVNHIPVLADVKDTNYMKYRNAFLLKPNRKELQELTGMAVGTLDQVRDASRFLCQRTSCVYVLTTLGADGMLLSNADGVILQAKSMAKEVFDVTGAGDTSIAYLAAGIISGKSIVDAVNIANYAAGIQVSKVGTSIVYPEEVEQAMLNQNSPLQRKQLDYYVAEGMNHLLCERARGRKIVFTNGCFDILHAGHVSYLRQAKEMGEVLVIGVNSDASVKRLKGESRPVNPLADRLMVLSALEFVDYVVPFEEDTPLKLIETITPDVLVKGGDYRREDIVGADYVDSHGGIVAIIPFVQGKSTTNILAAMSMEVSASLEKGNYPA